MKFPATKKAFIEWWDDQTDDLDPKQSREATCPIAKYLRAHGFPNAKVSESAWRAEAWSEHHDLPDWARRYVLAADVVGWPYRGLPEGFR